MIDFKFDFSKINAKLDKIKEAAGKAARPAAQAGAQAFYEEVKQRAPRSPKAHSTKGKKQTYQPGNLKKAVYQAFVEDESGANRATYRVSWNKDKAFYGKFVEFGTSRSAAQPFLRPAYEAKRGAAVEAVNDKMLDQVKAALK